MKQHAQLAEISGLLNQTQGYLTNESYVTALTQNFDESKTLYEKSVALRDKSQEGMTRELAAEIRNHIRNCDLKAESFAKNRMLSTSLLRRITSIFTHAENSISSDSSSSVNAVLCTIFCGYARDANFEIGNKIRQADIDLEDNLRAINEAEDLDDATRMELIATEKEKFRRLKAELRAMLYETETAVDVTGKEGYLALFNQWWNETGQYLDKVKLDTIFHTMIQYAKQSAKQCRFIQHSDVRYVEMPVLV